jgi:hypothetical protein
MQTYMQQHSNEQLTKELNDCKKQFQGGEFDPLKDCPPLAKRKFMVSYYSCPNQGGNRMHMFLNGMFWAMVSNRTMLWHYYDKETCQDIGAAHDPMLCEIVKTEEICSQYLKRAEWIPPAQEWSRTLKLSKPELSSWWSTHLPPSRDKKSGQRIDNRSKFLKNRHPWHEGDEKYTGIDVYPQRVLHIGQQHSWEARALKSEGNRDYLLNTTLAQQQAKDLLSADLPFLYGMLFDHSFSFHRAIRPNPNKIVDSNNMTTIGLHSRHGVVTVDGSDIAAEKECLSELLNGREGPCAVYIMSDRDITVELIKNYVENVLMCIAIVDSSDDNSAGFDGKFSEMGSNPGGFWKELALVSSARYGFIGVQRSSSKLLQEQMQYHSIIEGKVIPETCYLPDRERPAAKTTRGTAIEEKNRTTESEDEVASTPTIEGVQLASPPIQQISVLGERNSGTRWMYDHLSNCFNHSLDVEIHLTRYKHWFQDPNVTLHPRNRETLVIAQFRNPYDWLEAMRDRPHHAPSHLDVDWREFLTTPWTMDRIGLDLNITSNATLCQQHFRFNQINSCVKAPLPREAYENIRMSRHQPIYELKQDGSGEPFDSIIELRAAKIVNFLETKDYPRVADTWPVHYEYLLEKGTKQILDKIAKVTGIPYKCDPFPVQKRRKRQLPKDFMDYVDAHVDWTIEELIGYHRRSVSNQLTKATGNFFLNREDFTWNEA